MAERLMEIFAYHPPNLDQLKRYEAIRTAARHFAEVLLVNSSPNSDQHQALGLLRACVMHANASIALEGKDVL